MYLIIILGLKYRAQRTFQLVCLCALQVINRNILRRKRMLEEGKYYHFKNQRIDIYLGLLLSMKIINKMSFVTPIILYDENKNYWVVRNAQLPCSRNTWRLTPFFLNYSINELMDQVFQEWLIHRQKQKANNVSCLFWKKNYLKIIPLQIIIVIYDISYLDGLEIECEWSWLLLNYQSSIDRCLSKWPTLDTSFIIILVGKNESVVRNIF